eukprot:6211990-Pleurochrysis_carterae.AAC.5
MARVIPQSTSALHHARFVRDVSRVDRGHGHCRLVRGDHEERRSTCIQCFNRKRTGVEEGRPRGRS